MLFRKRLAAFLFILLCCLLLLIPTAPYSSANPEQSTLAAAPSASRPSSMPSFPDNEEARRLMQQTLSAAEIEKEIERIGAEQHALEQKTAALSSQAAKKKSDISEKEKRAGAVVRAYYTGDRDPLLTALLSAKTLSKWFIMLDYYEMIMGHDKEILAEYEKEYKDLRTTLAAAERSSLELAELRSALEEQKQRVEALHKDIDGTIQSSGNPESMAALLEEFTAYWQNIGIHEVKTYFKALSAAMNHLPQFVESRDGVLTRRGMTYELNLKEADLNEFLHSENKLFDNFAFTFENGSVIASGKSGDLSLRLQGHYTIQEEPMNGLMFHVDSIIFNSLELPDTTRKSLEEEFDLGFYPSKIVSFLHASEVDSKDGVLHVKLTLSF
ncbi:hypothetical protein SAMN04487895_109152 [Paenibacillus sophorae]|uniref:N-terminal domain of peptidoglycan hydrolase CwlO-containing protein n=1 Tax=Paenibacillus sophorae TaxID=1333845 RepID=A0A1H8R5K5_9BACL|nr:hypothetical protein [Paenibacillus sophorae]QWU14958.1 hypothetical protein KP014_24090 [Paenibacillus sophorae]SEO61607.1 hypothetical protein SAMN04487895_109152 [Paenibacillus sophorae]